MKSANHGVMCSSYLQICRYVEILRCVDMLQYKAVCRYANM